MIQQGDILVFQTNDDGDIIVEDGRVTMTSQFDTAVYLALFGGNEDDDGSQDSPKNWWGNIDEEVPAKRFRSETQNLLRSIPATLNNLKRIGKAAERDLEFFVSSGVASSVVVVVGMPGLNRISIDVSITAEGNETKFRFSENWKATEPPILVPADPPVPPPPDYGIIQLALLEHDISYARYSSFVMIDATHFMLAYSGFNGVGFIKTFSIDSEYEITEIDVLEHDPVHSNNNGTFNSLVMIDPTHFILAYSGDSTDGFIKTFSIDGSYAITELQSLEHEGTYAVDNSLVMIDSTHFMLAYGGVSDGWVKTFSIDGSYAITELDAEAHDTSQGIGNSLVMIDSTHFMLAYGGTDNDGYVKTFVIDGSYTITELNVLEHDTENGLDSSLVVIDATHFMLAYRGIDNDGWVKTFSIDGSYSITQLYSLEHDTGYAAFNSLVVLDSTHFMLAYAETGFDGILKTFEIDGLYAITQLDTLEHDTGEGQYNSLVMIDSTHSILAYTGESDDGYIKTFKIT